jgi:hypothetical protein
MSLGSSIRYSKSQSRPEQITNAHGNYAGRGPVSGPRGVGRLIDLHAMTRTSYEAPGIEPSALAFGDQIRDRTHHNNYGTYELAQKIVAGIRGDDRRLIDGLATPIATDAEEFDPRHPGGPATSPLTGWAADAVVVCPAGN